MIAAAIVLAAVLAPGASTPVPAAKTHLTVLTWGSRFEEEVNRRLVAAFTASHPEIDVELRVQPTLYEEKVRTLLAADLLPDVLYVGSYEFPALAPRDVFLDLEPFVRDAALGDYYGEVLDAFRWNGRLLGLPKDWTPFVLYYNADLFERAGVSPPTDAWTWDDYLAAAKKLTRDDDGDGEPDTWGCAQAQWFDAVLCWIMQNGGRAFERDADGHLRCVLDDPRTIEAVQFLRDLRWKHRVAYTEGLRLQQSQALNAVQLFMDGRVAMFGPVGRWQTVSFAEIAKRDRPFRWDVAPPPHQRERWTAIGTTAYCVSRKTAHPREAAALVRFLTGPEGSRLNAELGLAVPALRSVAASDAFLTPNAMPANDRVFLDVAPWSHVPPLTPWFKELNARWDALVERVLSLDRGDTGDELRRLARDVNDVIDEDERVQALPRVDPRVARAIGFAVLGAVVLLALLAFGPMRLGRSQLERREERTGLLFIAPWLVGFLVFALGPILASLLLSFSSWDAIGPVGDARIAGFDNYARMLEHDPLFWKSLRVTLLYTAASVPLGLVASLAAALLLNAPVRGVGIFRTIFYLPSVVSGVATAVLWWWVFGGKFGLLNVGLRAIGLPAPDWLADDHFTLAAFVMMSLWSIGGAMIVFLAGLQTIPRELYEAATLDGAGAWGRFRRVTMPMLSPVILFNLILGVIGSFQTFSQSFVMTSGGPNDATLFLVLYVYRNAFEWQKMGYAAALAWFLFVVILVCTLLLLRGSRSWVHYEGAER
ncbi:MAG: extracellular solute-binding protein [Planctomycetes bacterium]|nr:extracellular solute-binding protein [Planctomycetota bacterium]